jgi:hypothetical protein
LKINIFSRFLLISIIPLIVYTNLPSQNSLTYFKIGIPSNFGNTFYSDWDGIINVGFQYSNLRKRNLYLNIYFNYDRFKDTRYDWNSKQDLYKLGLGLQYKFMISESVNLFPQIGLGYVYQNVSNEQFDTSVDNSGLNVLTEIALLFKVTEKLNVGFGLRYDFVRLALPDYAGNSSYNRRIHTITPTAQIAVGI